MNQNHRLYQKLTQAAGEMMSEQIRAISWQEATVLLGDTSFTAAFWKNLRKFAAAIREAEEDAAFLAAMGDRLTVTLAAYPDCLMEVQRRRGEPVVTINLAGKPANSVLAEAR